MPGDGQGAAVRAGARAARSRGHDRGAAVAGVGEPGEDSFDVQVAGCWVRRDEMRSCLVLVVVALQAVGQEGGWKADPKLLAGLEEKKTAWIYREEKVPKYTLPDPLLCEDGSKVTTSEQWEKKRRPETLELFRRHVYGRQ